MINTTAKLLILSILWSSKTRVLLKCDLFRCDVMSEVVCVKRFIQYIKHGCTCDLIMSITELCGVNC